MKKFLKLPEMRWVSYKHGWRLTSHLIFRSDTHGLVVVPVGFETNLASVPRLPMIHLLAAGRANMPAVLHDFLYGCCKTNLTRKEADKIFLEAMRDIAEPASALTQFAMYIGVRIGGRRHWRKLQCIQCPLGEK